MKTKIVELYSERASLPGDDFPFVVNEVRLTRMGLFETGIAIIHLETQIKRKHSGNWETVLCVRTIFDLYEDPLSDAELVRLAIAAFDDFVLTAPLNYSEQAEEPEAAND